MSLITMNSNSIGGSSYIRSHNRHNIFLNSYGIKEHWRLCGQNRQYEVDENTIENVSIEIFDMIFNDNDRLG